jgi:hypothetical protein
LLLLGALGVAIGITAANPDQPNARMGLIAAAYAGGSLLVALFVGGLVSTRIGAIYDGATGFWEGALVWVVSVLLLGYLTASGVSSLVGGAFSMMGNASQAMGSMMQGGPTTGDAARAVDQAKSRLQDALSSGQIQQKAEALQQKAAQAKPAATRAAWVTFGGFVLSLAAAIGGAMAGRRRRPVPRG